MTHPTSFLDQALINKEINELCGFNEPLIPFYWTSFLWFRSFQSWIEYWPRFLSRSAEQFSQHCWCLTLLTLLTLFLYNNKDNLSWVWVRPFMAARRHPEPKSLENRLDLIRNEEQDSAVSHDSCFPKHIACTDLLWLIAICRRESSWNSCFVLMCPVNHEPVFDPSPICLHAAATGPQAGLRPLAFTPYFCLSNSISSQFHH